MDGAEFVHMVALIGTGTRVHEGKHTGYKQGGLVVRHRKRTREDGASLAILALAITEEQRVGSRIVVPQLTSLSHKATAQHGAIIYTRAAGNDEIIADNPVADMYRSRFVAINTSVGQTARPADIRIVADTHVLDGTGIDNGHMRADSPRARSVFVGVIVRYLLQSGYQLGTVAIEGHDVSLMGRELVVDRNFAASGLVENRNLHAVAERGLAIDHNHVHVFNERVATNLVIGYVVLNVLNTAVVAHGDVVERHVAQTGVLSDAPGHDKILFKHTQTDRAGETGVVYIIGCEALCYLYLVPVV